MAVVARGGTIESIKGVVPTEAQAKLLIEDARGRVLRVEGPHDDPRNPHQYEHINYSLPHDRGTIKIQP